MLNVATREGSSTSSEKSRRNKKPNRRKRAKQWTFLIEKLKLTVDGLYEICREEQNLNGCKEALMYLQNSSRDFESLIASIHVELSWEEAEKPQAVAWEIRKSMSSPSNVMKDPASIMTHLPITPLMFSEVVKAASDRRKTTTVPAGPTADENATVLPKTELDDDENKDEWQVVRGRKKRSLSSVTSESRDDLDMIEHTTSSITRPSNVYERLSSTTRRYPPLTRPTAVSSSSSSVHNSNYLCPKSAMDLPQTKASMAKMAYSRQLLWQRSQSSLIEKMKARQTRHRTADFNSGGGAAPRRQNVTEGAMRGIEKKSPSDASSEASRNLHSIRETIEDDKAEMIPVDPKPTAEPVPVPPVPTSGCAAAESAPSPTVDDVTTCLSTSSAPPTLRAGNAWTGARGDSSSHDDNDSRLSFPLSNPEMLNLECDREWREMTEEEESLAFEERSLNIEIEQEQNVSIDAELERQVAMEADALEREERRARREERERVAAAEEKDKETTGTVGATAEEEEEEQPDYEEIMKMWQKDMAELATVSWSELVERELAAATTTHLREPGDAAVRHERMMSPSRKRIELTEEDLSRRHEEKQRRADELREKLQADKAARLKSLLQKVEEVREKRAELTERKRRLMESRLRNAEANRERNIEEIVRRAREDEMKVKEAQLIHTLGVGNMRHDQQMREQRTETRRERIAEVRAKRQEEKAAKDAAVEERRRLGADTKSDGGSIMSTSDIMDDVGVSPVPSLEEQEAPGTKEEEDRLRYLPFDWTLSIEAMTSSVKTADETVTTTTVSSGRKWACTECAEELPSEWDAIGHVLSVEKHAEEWTRGEAGEHGWSANGLITFMNSYVRLLNASDSESNKENDKAEVSAKTRKKQRRTEQMRAKESVDALASAIGGRHGPSVDAWRDLFGRADVRVRDDDALREVTLFGKKNGAKKPEEALEKFVREYARREPSQTSELILLTVVDGALQSLSARHRSISSCSNTVIERKAAEDTVWRMLDEMAAKERAAFARLFSLGPRLLKLVSFLMARIRDDQSTVTSSSKVTSSSTPLSLTVFRLLAKVAALSERHQLLLCGLFSSPRIFSSMPIAHLVMPPTRSTVLATVVALTVHNHTALQLMSAHLSPFHCAMFLKSEQAAPSAPLRSILSTAEEITKALDFYDDKSSLSLTKDDNTTS